MDRIGPDCRLHREQDRRRLWSRPGLLDIVLGIVGAVVGGYLFSALGVTGVTGFNLYSMFVAVVGAALVRWIYHAGAGRGV